MWWDAGTSLRLLPFNNDTLATEGLQGAQPTRQVERPRLLIGCACTLAKPIANAN
jgi:hypothetical protein